MDNEMTIKLVTALQAGDQNAAGQLYEACYQDIYYFILKTVKEKELAEDLTQDTFIKIMESIGQLQEPGAFVGWSRQIAYHSCTAYFRKRKDLLADEMEDGSTVFDAVTEENAEFIPHEALDKEDLKQTILAMIDALPEEQRAAIMLRYYEELPVAQIARIQQVSEGTVKSRLNYGRKAIRKTVEEYEKKNNVKLHSIAILPLLLWLFRKLKLAKGMSVTAAAGTTAATGAAAAGTATAGAAAKGFFSTVAGKIAAAILAVAVVAGGVAAIIGLSDPQTSKHDSEDAGQVTVDSEGAADNVPIDREFLHTQVVSLIFTDVAVPEGMEPQDVSSAQDGSVLAWKEETAAPEGLEGLTFYDVYVTTADGGTLYAPEDSSGLFARGGGQSYNASRLQKIVFENFDTRYVTNMSNMFAECANLQQIDLSGWDVSGVQDMSQMFFYCEQLPMLDLSGWDVSGVKTMAHMFGACMVLTEAGVSDWDVSGVQTMEGMFSGCYALTELDLSAWDVSGVQTMAEMFADSGMLRTLNVSGWDVSGVQNMESMFRDCAALQTVDVSGWDVSGVQNMACMFWYCPSLTALDVSGWDVSGVQTMENAFSSCSALTVLDVSAWDVSNVQNMALVFEDCSALTMLDVSGWDVSSVENMLGTFRNCAALEALDVSGWDVSRVGNMNDMFFGCSALTVLDVSAWDVSNVQVRDDMFTGCDSLPDSVKNMWN